MARHPRRVDDQAVVERVIQIPGWIYNLMIDLAAEQHRNVQSQVVFELERSAQRIRKTRLESTPDNA